MANWALWAITLISEFPSISSESKWGTLGIIHFIYLLFIDLLFNYLFIYYLFIYFFFFFWGGVLSSINSSTPSAAYVRQIGSGNGLSPVRRQAITWTNADLLSIGPLETNYSETQIKIQKFSFMKMHFKISSVKWRPVCPGEDELNEN